MEVLRSLLRAVEVIRGAMAWEVVHPKQFRLLLPPLIRLPLQPEPAARQWLRARLRFILTLLLVLRGLIRCVWVTLPRYHLPAEARG